MSLDIHGDIAIDQPNSDDCELILFRLTDSVCRAFEELGSTLGGESFRLSINDKHHHLILPLPTPRKFMVTLADLNNNTDGSLDCLKLESNSVQHLGKFNSKITVQAKDDSFNIAKERMAQLEDVNRKPKTKEVNIGKRKTVKTLSARGIKDRLSGSASLPASRNNSALNTPSPANTVPSATRYDSPSSTGSARSPVINNRVVSTRSLRDRVVHLLAIRPYERPELLLRLARDGLSPNQKAELDVILAKVGKITRGSAYCLSPSLFSELDPLWPGYTETERNRVFSLKESGQQRQYQHGHPQQNSRTSGQPVCPAADRSDGMTDDQFGRRPTRASAPIAPHSLRKKIAALDLLASGVDLESVAKRVGVGQELLVRWRSNEADLRERFKRLNSDTDMDSTSSTIPAQPRQSKRNDSIASSTSSDRLSKSKTTLSHPTNISLPKSSRSENLSAPLVNQKFGEHNATSRDNLGRTERYNKINREGHTAHPPTPTSDTKPSLDPLYSNSTRHFPFRPFLGSTNTHSTLVAGPVNAGGCGTGSEGESASHTPCSNVSSVGSADNNVNTAASAHSISSRYQTEREQQLSCGTNASCSSASCDLDDVTDSVLPAHDHGPHQNSSNSAGKPSLPHLRESSHSLSPYSTDLSVQLQDINRLYPKITSLNEADRYRAEFRSTYPTYLRMYDSFTDVWHNVDKIHAELIDASERDGLDNPRCTDLANRLERLLQNTRTPKYHESLSQLTLLAHKLRLLKQRLAEIRVDSNGRHPVLDEYSSYCHTENGASQTLKRKLHPSPMDYDSRNSLPSQTLSACPKRSAIA